VAARPGSLSRPLAPSTPWAIAWPGSVACPPLDEPPHLSIFCSRRPS